MSCPAMTRAFTLAAAISTLGCGDQGYGPGHPILPTGLYEFSIRPADGGWGPAVSLPAGHLEIHESMPDALVVRWDESTAQSPDILQVAHFVDGAYTIRMPHAGWIIDYRLWLEDGGPRCDALFEPQITEPTVCSLTLQTLTRLQLPQHP